MQKRGFVNAWQNRHWIGVYSALSGGGSDPSIKPGGTGSLPDFLTFTIKGTGYNYYDDDDDRIRYDAEKCFVSPVFRSSAGSIFRFCVLYTRSSHASQSADCYFCIVDCNSTGIISSGGSGDNLWNGDIGSSGTAGKAYLLWSGSAKEKWDRIISEIPYIENEAYNLMVNRAERLYNEVLSTSYEGTIDAELLAMKIYARAFWNSEPLYWVTPETSTNEIVSRARSLSGYKYWYGGAGQVATQALANSLRQSYSSIWTQSYYTKALADIGQRVGDCSYLVNYAYGIASPGSHGPGTSEYLSRYSKWSSAPKDGMIAWRNGHTGIYAGGKTLELVGIDYDYQERNYDASKWTAILYDPNRAY